MGVDFTIAVPTHDRRETALLAVRSVLAQTRQAARVIVLCDGCSDGTAEAVRALGDARVTALDLPKGPGYSYACRDRALETDSEVVLWLADDDLLLPDHLERIGAFWDTGAFDLVQTGSVQVAPDDSLSWVHNDWSVPSLRRRLEGVNSNPMASISVRRSLVLDVGGWDGTLPRSADWDLWKRMLAAGARSVASPEPTHLYFKGTGRVQAWEERIAQNSAWLERLGDPARLAQLRIELRRVRDALEAETRDRVDEAWRCADDNTAWARRTEAERDHAWQRVAELDAALADARTVLEQRDTRVQELELRVAGAETEAARLGSRLARIEQGRWWRLRAQLLPLARRLGLARG
ncbi:glycosyltransferase [Conexibacter sp. JD483]|uniref:glycosyltransferase family 2 protein n=1 Tax=unclassified Conexibacter TaxID=2627773 RepID=UPI00271C732E|nr:MULTISPECIES: glycosyltransferase [unclassified Conexibacter]MDO8184800.1 glycosyltransferase [Conexibacter sp. CPCC 205706]MDO8196575.1 glycosyltransferase [Conexibacter sp. CPCC 205762]MDR9368712.1 glycosyltransferase [Conexibacter sp. JD483]